jgi:hypothetical protein
MPKRKRREKRIGFFSSPYPDAAEVVGVKKRKRKLKIKEVRRTEVAEICEVRKESGLSCRNCIYWDSPAKKCSEDEYIQRYNHYLAAKKAANGDA